MRRSSQRLASRLRLPGVSGRLLYNNIILRVRLVTRIFKESVSLNGLSICSDEWREQGQRKVFLFFLILVLSFKCGFFYRPTFKNVLSMYRYASFGEAGSGCASEWKAESWSASKSRAGSLSGSASKSQLKSSRLRFLLNKMQWAEGRHPDAVHKEDGYGQEKCTDEWNISTERRAGTQTQFTMKTSMGRKICADEWSIRTERRAGTQTQFTIRMGMGRMKCADEWNIRTERRAGTQTQFTMKMSMGRKKYN